jgi:hypothetical protein
MLVPRGAGVGGMNGPAVASCRMDASLVLRQFGHSLVPSLVDELLSERRARSRSRRMTVLDASAVLALVHDGHHERERYSCEHPQCGPVAGAANPTPAPWCRPVAG